MKNRFFTMEIGHSYRVRMLYKTIFKLHKGLPKDLAVIGNSYAREEFKRHKKCTPAETSIFMVEWAKYAVTLSEQIGLKGIRESRKLGTSLSESTIYSLSDDQVYQLYELLEASQGVNNENHKHFDS